MNRRTFLNTFGVAAASAAGAGAAPRIRTAFWGTRHSHFTGKLKTVSDNPSFDLVGVCEPLAEARARVKVQPQWLTEEQLLADASIRLVVVEMPAGESAAFAQKAIAAGKHVHVEKPPTDHLATFQELIQEARRKELLVQAGYIWRFHDGISRAIEAARKGWLGEVYMMRGAIHTDITAESRQELSRFRGGMMFELGSHQIDRVVDLFGRPKTVKSWLQKTSIGKQDRLADNTLAVFEYDSALAIITTSARMPGASQHRSFEVIGTEGAILIQPVEPGTGIRVSMREARGPYRAGWQDIQLPPQARYIGDFQDLARAIQTGTPLKYSYDYELLVQETILRASQDIQA